MRPGSLTSECHLVLRPDPAGETLVAVRHLAALTLLAQRVPLEEIQERDGTDRI